jgi:hypothetical protein
VERWADRESSVRASTSNGGVRLGALPPLSPRDGAAGRVDEERVSLTSVQLGQLGEGGRLMQVWAGIRRGGVHARQDIAL